MNWIKQEFSISRYAKNLILIPALADSRFIKTKELLDACPSCNHQELLRSSFIVLLSMRDLVKSCVTAHVYLIKSVTLNLSVVCLLICLTSVCVCACVCMWLCVCLSFCVCVYHFVGVYVCVLLLCVFVCVCLCSMCEIMVQCLKTIILRCCWW